MVIHGTAQSFAKQIQAFRQGLRDLGYIEGQNLKIEYRFYPPEQPDLLPDIANELVRSNVDVLLAVSTPEIRALMQATSTIPIVMLAPGDPVGAGLVASLGHPGGNVTGLTQMSTDLSGKRLELLKDAVSGISRVAVLFNPANPAARRDAMELQHAGRARGITIHLAEVRQPEELSSAFSSMTRAHDGGVIVVIDALVFTHRRVILDLAARHRLPSVFYIREFAELGGLVSYGPNGADGFRHAATYVDKILKGAKPADLPVEQPTKFELVVNLKTAKALGITIPESILLRADEVIR
jgi:putative ABC transport system substrate-binding protein